MNFSFIIIAALLLSSVQGSRMQRKARRAKAAANRRASAEVVRLTCAGIEKYFPEENCPSCPTVNSSVADYWKQHCAPLYKEEEKMSVMQVFVNAFFFFVTIGTACTMLTNFIRK